MLPVIFVAVRRGVVPGVATGVVFGLLQLILPGALIYHPLQAALDYPLAYAAVGLAGWCGSAAGGRWLALVWQCARFVFHFLSGLLFFATYVAAWEGPGRTRSPTTCSTWCRRRS